MNSHIILASSSPRRIEMMQNNGIQPIIMPSNVDESLPLDMTMEQAVMYLALKKALDVEKLWLKESANPSDSCVIIAADTVVYKDGIIGKPNGKSEAEQILKRLRNTNHFVATGVAMVQPSAKKRSVFFDVTKVFFKDYSDEEIESYIRTDEPWDKAGGYAIQGAWGKHVSHIIGDYNNVMGFPWNKIKGELDNHWTEINTK